MNSKDMIFLRIARSRAAYFLRSVFSELNSLTASSTKTANWNHWWIPKWKHTKQDQWAWRHSSLGLASHWGWKVKDWSGAPISIWEKSLRPAIKDFMFERLLHHEKSKLVSFILIFRFHISYFWCFDGTNGSISWEPHRCHSAHMTALTKRMYPSDHGSILRTQNLCGSQLYI